MSACWCGGKKQPRGFAHRGDCPHGNKSSWLDKVDSSPLTDDDWKSAYRSIMATPKMKMSFWSRVKAVFR